MQDFYDRLGETWSVTRQADPNHLGSTQSGECVKQSRVQTCSQTAKLVKPENSNDSFCQRPKVEVFERHRKIMTAWRRRHHKMYKQAT